MKYKLVLLFIGFSIFSSAQLQFIRKDSVPVFKNSQQLNYAWTGGLNCTQYSEIDLNQDGIMDLFVFDRTGNKITTFLNSGTPNQIAYYPAMQYVSKFPRMHDWVILRDFNCDGKVDIFTSNSSKVEVYENISTISTGLQFQLFTPNILADLTPNSTHNIAPINVSWIDIPAIRDVDGDGDLDILNFGLNGYQVEFYKNRSEELFGSCDSLKFTLETLCWGEFTESQLDATITLNTPCAAPPIASENASHNPLLHAGSCLECLDIDGDQDQDLIVGDLTNPNINLIRNGGTTTAALGDLVDVTFPNYDTAMTLQIFGCGFHLDVDNDGQKDLLFSPNAFNSVENAKSVWYYHNNGTDSTMVAHLIQKDFLQDKMIEVGEGAAPTYFDYDNDGDMDLFIGTRGYYNASGIPDVKLSCYKNTGSQTTPTFTLLSEDFAGIFAAGINMNGMSPTFGDLDGDGDKDLLIGDVNGKLNYFRKVPGNDTNFVLDSTNYAGIDVGSFATPQLIDVDRDGKIDLLIGEQTGNINYYHNNGTVTNPTFSLVTPLFGNVIVTQAGFTTGYSTPFLYDNAGQYVLLCGSERGYLFRYDNIDGNLSGNFTLTDSLYVSQYEGGRIAAAATDLNNDGLMDVTIGNLAGGVSLFYGDNTISIAEISPETQFELFPNPASSQVTIDLALPVHDQIYFSIYDLSGKIVLRKELTEQKTNIPTYSLSNGIYICKVSSSKGFTLTKKLVISR